MPTALKVALILTAMLSGLILVAIVYVATHGPGGGIGLLEPRYPAAQVASGT